MTRVNPGQLSNVEAISVDSGLADAVRVSLRVTFQY